jgi:hypothetical protein
MYPQGTPVGVANVDACKHVDVISPLERVLDELLKRKFQLASDALGRPADKTEFGYGRVCGMFQAYEDVRSLLEHCLSEGDPESAERHSKS